MMRLLYRDDKIEIMEINHPNGYKCCDIKNRSNATIYLKVSADIINGGTLKLIPGSNAVSQQLAEDLIKNNIPYVT